MIAPAGSEIGADWQPDAAPWDGSRRLWSLWEIMIHIRFGEVIKNLHDRLAWSVFTGLENTHGTDRSIVEIMDSLKELLLQFEEMGLVIPSEYIRDTIKMIRLSRGVVNKTEFEKTLNLTIWAVEIECRGKIFFELDNATNKYYNGEVLFGDEFVTKFSSALFELDEAGKCFSLSRPTAAVFHLMRLMEIAIRAVARCLQIPDPIKPADRNWGAMLRALKSAMDLKTQSSV